MRRRTRPDNELPVSVAMDVVLARTPDLAIAISGALVYRNGVSFTVTTLSRTSRHPDIFGPGRWGRAAGQALLLGVEFADGRRASTVGGQLPDPDTDDDDLPGLAQGGGGSSDRRSDAEFFLTPVPPPGLLSFVVVWEDAGLPETTVTTSADALAAAVDRVVELWPWQPIDRECPPAPDPPSTGWFAGP